ncbi:MAG: 2-amino-4-hydroxy-6-hydroxymethyldihydropteridine diphosphokinase, partial [Muribaculaceae bacterium]|nr:2-amino-4-hydroxy-6-hydroxymethyldihydropteridine diphosphokinase [Muribaculaceae bacterium]
FQHVRTSSVYEMPAINGRDASYLNAVVIFRTDLSADEITQIFKSVELDNGRSPLSKIEGHIPLDLDLVIYDSTIVSYKEYCQEYFMHGMRELNADTVRPHAMI